MSTRARLFAVLIALTVGVGTTTTADAGAVTSPLATWTTSSSVPGSIEAISCPSVVWCMAIGAGASLGTPPTVWTWAPAGFTQVVGTPTGGFSASDALFAVSCPSSSECVVVGARSLPGGGTVPLVARWSLGRWTVRQLDVAAPGGNDLSGVSCATVTSCVAVGDQIPSPSSPISRSLIDTVSFSSGTGIGSWVTTTHPTIGLSDSLSAISCPTAGTCVAVGSARTPGTLSYQPLIETLASGTWTVTSTSSATPGYFSGVGCMPDGSCVAVGSTTGEPATTSQPLIASSNGAKWTSATLKIDGGALADVACVAVTGCRAVGTITTSSGLSHPLAVAVVASVTSAFTPVALPPGDAAFTAVSCPATGECRFARVTGDGTGVRSDLVRTAPPFIRLLAPAQGPTKGGTKVTVTGLDLTGVNAVTVDGIVARITKVLSPTQLVITTPRHAVGPTQVVLGSPRGSSPATPLSIFTYR